MYTTYYSPLQECYRDEGNIDDDVVRRVEDVWSLCTLKKVELSTSVVGSLYSVSAVSNSTLLTYTFP